MLNYTRITLEERERILLLQQSGMLITDIAEELSRHKSSISRELQRCKGYKYGYMPHIANDDYKSKLSRNKALFLDSRLRDYVIDKIKIARWSPEQISGRLKFEKKLKYACKETIYKFIYSKEGIANNLSVYLRQRRKKRGFRKSRKHHGSTIPSLVSIHDRPAAIEKRRGFGNWEGDLIIYGTTNPRNVTTLVERKTRFTKLVVNSSKRSSEVIDGIKKAFTYDRETLRSITFDRGAEFTRHYELPAKIFFCDAASPWQKGSVENTNGRIRHIMPRKTTPRLFRQEHLDQVQYILNNTPRKILGYKTPLEAFNTNLNKLTPNCCARS